MGNLLAIRGAHSASVCEDLNIPWAAETALVRPDLDPTAHADFLVSIMEGSASVGKVGQELHFFRNCIEVAQAHLASLATAPQA